MEMNQSEKSLSSFWKATMLIVSMLILVQASGCTTFIGVSSKGNEVYLTGNTNYMFFTNNWVRRCVRMKSRLACQNLEMEVVEELPGQQERNKMENISMDDREKQLERAMPELTRPTEKRKQIARENNHASINRIGPQELSEKYRNAIAEKFGMISSCRSTYAKQVNEILFEIQMKPDGNVKEVTMRTKTNSGSFDSCVSRVLSTAEFKIEDAANLNGASGFSVGESSAFCLHGYSIVALHDAC